MKRYILSVMLCGKILYASDSDSDWELLHRSYDQASKQEEVEDWSDKDLYYHESVDRIKSQQDKVHYDFFQAIQRGDLQRVYVLQSLVDIQALRKVSRITDSGYSPLLVAVQAEYLETIGRLPLCENQGRLHIIRYLLSLPGIACNQEARASADFITPLHFVIQHKRNDVLLALLAHKDTDVHQKGFCLIGTPLFHAISVRNQFAVEQLLARDDVDPFYENDSDENALDIAQGGKRAISPRKNPIVDLVCKAMNIRKKTDPFYTVQQSLDIFKASLVDAKNINRLRAIKDGRAKISLLHRCISHIGVESDSEREEKLRNLLRCPGIDVNVTAHDGITHSFTPLQQAFGGKIVHWAIPILLADERVNVRCMFSYYDTFTWLKYDDVNQKGLQQQFYQHEIDAIFQQLWKRAGLLWDLRHNYMPAASYNGVCQWILSGFPPAQLKAEEFCEELSTFSFGSLYLDVSDQEDSE